MEPSAAERPRRCHDENAIWRIGIMRYDLGILVEERTSPFLALSERREGLFGGNLKPLIWKAFMHQPHAAKREGYDQEAMVRIHPEIQDRSITRSICIDRTGRSK